MVEAVFRTVMSSPLFKIVTVLSVWEPAMDLTATTHSRRGETLQHGNQVISALFEDNHRQLWIGTDDGVYIQDLATGKFSFFDARTESGEQIRYNWIEDILADHSGNIWVNAPNQGV